MTPTTNHIQGILISCTDVHTIEQRIGEIRDWAQTQIEFIQNEIDREQSQEDFMRMHYS